MSQMVVRLGHITFDFLVQSRAGRSLTLLQLCSTIMTLILHQPITYSCLERLRKAPCLFLFHVWNGLPFFTMNCNATLRVGAGHCSHVAPGFRGNVLDVRNEATYRFLETVLTEVLELFPGPVHVGMDEIPAKAWSQKPQEEERGQDVSSMINVDFNDMWMLLLCVYLRTSLPIKTDPT